MNNTITPDKLKEGQTAIIRHWVNQPDYVNEKLRMENGKLIKTDKNGFETLFVDMRYPHFCKIEILK